MYDSMRYEYLQMYDSFHDTICHDSYINKLKSENKILIKCSSCVNTNRWYFIKCSASVTIDQGYIDENKAISFRSKKKLDIRLMLLRVDRDSLSIIRNFLGPVNVAMEWLIGLEAVAVKRFNLNPRPKIRIESHYTLYTWLLVFSESEQRWRIYQQMKPRAYRNSLGRPYSFDLEINPTYPTADFSNLYPSIVFHQDGVVSSIVIEGEEGNENTNSEDKQQSTILIVVFVILIYTYSSLCMYIRCHHGCLLRFRLLCLL